MLIQPHLAVDRRLGEQQAGENLARGADLERGVRIGFLPAAEELGLPLIRAGQRAIDPTDRKLAVQATVYALLQAREISIGRQRLCAKGGRNQRQQQEESELDRIIATPVSSRQG
ncbi:MAG TPA: hypothetical protein VN599_09790 [Rudaea sp.]|nr:hypothetical protein [Rudaea sp.]